MSINRKCASCTHKQVCCHIDEYNKLSDIINDAIKDKNSELDIFSASLNCKFYRAEDIPTIKTYPRFSMTPEAVPTTYDDRNVKKLDIDDFPPRSGLVYADPKNTKFIKNTTGVSTTKEDDKSDENSDRFKSIERW